MSVSGAGIPGIRWWRVEVWDGEVVALYILGAGVSGCEEVSGERYR